MAAVSTMGGERERGQGVGNVSNVLYSRTHVQSCAPPHTPPPVPPRPSLRTPARAPRVSTSSTPCACTCVVDNNEVAQLRRREVAALAKPVIVLAQGTHHVTRRAALALLLGGGALEDGHAPLAAGDGDVVVRVVHARAHEVGHARVDAVVLLPEARLHRLAPRHEPPERPRDVPRETEEEIGACIGVYKKGESSRESCVSVRCTLPSLYQVLFNLLTYFLPHTYRPFSIISFGSVLIPCSAHLASTTARMRRHTSATSSTAL